MTRCWCVAHESVASFATSTDAAAKLRQANPQHTLHVSVLPLISASTAPSQPPLPFAGSYCVYMAFLLAKFPLGSFHSLSLSLCLPLLDVSVNLARLLVRLQDTVTFRVATFPPPPPLAFLCQPACLRHRQRAAFCNNLSKNCTQTKCDLAHSSIYIKYISTYYVCMYLCMPKWLKCRLGRGVGLQVTARARARAEAALHKFSFAFRI